MVKLPRGSVGAEWIEGLGRTGDPRALPHLLKGLRSRRLAAGALRGLGHLEDESLLPLLERAAFCDGTWRAALEAMGLTGSEKALTFLESYARAAALRGWFDRENRARRAVERIRGRR